MTAQTDTLPACAHRHPGQPSVIKVTICRRTNGTVFERAHCSLCKSVSAKAQNSGRAAVRKPYGTLPLSWTPPERLLAAPVVEPAPYNFRQLLERFRARQLPQVES